MIDRPTGAPPTDAPGMLICGTPVKPPWLVRQLIRSLNGASTLLGNPLSGAGNGVVGRHRIVPGGSRYRSRARASIRINDAALRSASDSIEPNTRFRATLNAMRGLHVSSHGSNVFQDSLLCSTR